MSNHQSSSTTPSPEPGHSAGTKRKRPPPPLVTNNNHQQIVVDQEEEEEQDRKLPPTTDTNKMFQKNNNEKGKYGAAAAAAAGEKGNAEQDEEQGEEDDEEAWTQELHRLFVEAIYESGLAQSSPSVILQHMSPRLAKKLTSERLKSHLQKYRKYKQKSKDDFMNEYDSFLQKAWAVGEAAAAGVGNISKRGSMSGGIISSQVVVQQPEAMIQMMGKGRLAGGDVAALLTYLDMTQETNAKRSKTSQDADKEDCKPVKRSRGLDASTQELDPTAYSEGRQQEDLWKHFAGTHLRIPFPTLTEEERQTPLGVSLLYVSGLISAYTQHMIQERMKRVAGVQALADDIPFNAAALMVGLEKDDDAISGGGVCVPPEDSSSATTPPRMPQTAANMERQYTATRGEEEVAASLAFKTGPDVKSMDRKNRHNNGTLIAGTTRTSARSNEHYKHEHDNNNINNLGPAPSGEHKALIMPMLATTAWKSHPLQLQKLQQDEQQLQQQNWNIQQQSNNLILGKNINPQEQQYQEQLYQYLNQRTDFQPPQQPSPPPPQLQPPQLSQLQLQQIQLQRQQFGASPFVVRPPEPPATTILTTAGTIDRSNTPGPLFLGGRESTFPFFYPIAAAAAGNLNNANNITGDGSLSNILISKEDDDSTLSDPWS